MKRKILASYSRKDILILAAPILGLLAILILAFTHLDAAPPDHLTISTGDDQGDLLYYAKKYQAILKDEGVRLDIRSSTGPLENLDRLQDENSGVDAAFVQDGLGSQEKQPDIVSLGSLYYEPIWIFYRGKTPLTYFSQLAGKRVAVGKEGHANRVIAERLLKLCGVDPSAATLVYMDAADSVKALEKGAVDAAVFMKPAQAHIIHDLAMRPDIRLMDVEHAEAIARKDPAFHHLVLPRGAIDLKADIPNKDVDLVASTATLLVSDELHPALAFLLLKAAAQIHSRPAIFERRGEFPTNKDDVFPLSDDAVQFYKSGGPFWQRYLPYWLAAWFDRFVLLVIPVLAFIIPLIKTIPQLYRWRLRQRIYQRYGELKFLETQIKASSTRSECRAFLDRLDSIEDRVDKMQMPKTFAEYVYSLKGHIQFVRDRLLKVEAGAK